MRKISSCLIFGMLAVYVFLHGQSAFAGTCWNGGYEGIAPWIVLDHAGGSPSCEIADINYCVGTVAADGDTVRVTKAGTCTWNTRLITLTKAVKLIGAGKDTTIINSGYSVGMDWALDPEEYLIAIVPAVPADNPSIRISGFTFNFSNTSRGILYYNTSHHLPVYDLTNIRLDHLTLRAPASSFAVLYRYGLAHGVMDHCDITGSFYMGGHSELWSTHRYEYGRASNFYFEDNTWNAQLGRYEGNGAARYAFRYNTIIEPNAPGGSGNIQLLEQHGNQYNSQSSCFGAELYGNEIISVNNVNRPLEFYRQRGGKTMAFNNQMTATAYSKIYVMEEHPDHQGAGVATGPWGQPQHVSDSYYFSNYSNSSLLVPDAVTDICTGKNSKGVNTPSIDACYHKREVLNGTATGGSTTTLEEDGRNFATAGVSAGDFVVNISKAKERYHAEQARIASISSSNGYTNNVLVFSNAMHSVNSGGDSYRILSSVGGVATGGTVSTLTDSGRNFMADGVAAGDYIVNISKDGYTYSVAKPITSITTTNGENDTLNFSAMDVPNEAGDVYYIARKTDGLSADIDFWHSVASFTGASGVGCGALADRPATCTAGVGYWATDQSCTDLTGRVGKNPATPISGTLYKCTATDVWEAYYTPFTYPHPLRIDDDIIPPAAPGGFNVH